MYMYPYVPYACLSARVYTVSKRVCVSIGKGGHWLCHRRFQDRGFWNEVITGLAGMDLPLGILLQGAQVNESLPWPYPCALLSFMPGPAPALLPADDLVAGSVGTGPSGCL